MTDETGELVYVNGIDATTGDYLIPSDAAGPERRTPDKLRRVSP
jgi:hypothetical protein